MLISDVTEGARVKHHRAEAVYVVIGLGRFVSGHAIDQAVYRLAEGGQIWIRPLPEFLERFEVVTETPPEPAP